MSVGIFVTLPGFTLFGSLAVGVGVVLLLSACGSPVEVVRDDAVMEGSSAPLTVQELEAVGEFLAESGRVPEREPFVSGSGAVAVLPDEVVSVTADPVAQAWSYPAENITDVGVTPDGSSAVVRYDESFGPVDFGWLVVLNAANGAVRESYRELGSNLGDIGELTEDSRVRVEDGNVLVSYPLDSADARWERQLDDACGSGAPEEVGVTALVNGVVSSYACPGDEAVHVEVLGSESGEVLWDTSWSSDSVPEVQVSRPKEVPGGEYEPVDRMFRDRVTGQTLILSPEVDRYVPVELDPWRSQAGVIDYIDHPLLDMGQVPERIIFSDDLPQTRLLMIVRSVHALVEDESIPFSESDVDETLKIEGELAENPFQWETECLATFTFFGMKPRMPSPERLLRVPLYRCCMPHLWCG